MCVASIFPWLSIPRREAKIYILARFNSLVFQRNRVNLRFISLLWTQDLNKEKKQCSLSSPTRFSRDNCCFNFFRDWLECHVLPLQHDEMCLYSCEIRLDYNTIHEKVKKCNAFPAFPAFQESMGL